MRRELGHPPDCTMSAHNDANPNASPSINAPPPCVSDAGCAGNMGGPGHDTAATLAAAADRIASQPVFYESGDPNGEARYVNDVVNHPHGPGWQSAPGGCLVQVDTYRSWCPYQENGLLIAANNGSPSKPLTPQQKQCLNNAAQDHNTAVQRAHQDANHTWWVDIRNSVGGGAVGGCVVGAIGGEGVGCLPGGAIGALGGWLWGVPSGLWDASNQLDAAMGRAQEDYQTAQQRCVQ